MSTCRHCVYFSPTFSSCLEWEVIVQSTDACGRFSPLYGESYAPNPRKKKKVLVGADHDERLRRVAELYNTPPGQRPMEVREIVKHLGVSPRTIYKWIKEAHDIGLIPEMRGGGYHRRRQNREVAKSE